jgi:hypothetical protein
METAVRMIIGILLILLSFWVSGSDRVYALRQRAYARELGPAPWLLIQSHR